MADIAVQRGTVAVPNTGATTSPGTTFGSLSSTLVRCANNRAQSGGRDDLNAGNLEIDDISAGVRLTATNTITVDRQSGGQASNMRVAWESWEYTGSPGGAYEFIVRSRDTVTLASVTSATATLTTTPTDIDACIPFITGARSAETADDADACCAIAWLSGANTLNVARGGNHGTTVVEVTTVEFTGSAWQVAHGRVESAADTGTVTLVDAADGTTAGGGDISDWSTAAIFGYFRGNDRNGVDDSISDTSCVYTPDTLTTAVDWTHNANHADAGTSQNGQHMLHVLRCADMSVTRVTNTSRVAGVNNVTVSGLTTLAESGAIVRRTSSGGGTAYGRGWVNWRLTSTTNCELWVHRSGNTVNTDVQVIDFSGLVDSGSPQNIDGEAIAAGNKLEQPAVTNGPALGIDLGSASVGAELFQPAITNGPAINVGLDPVAVGAELFEPALEQPAFIDLATLGSGLTVSNPAVTLGPALSLELGTVASASTLSEPAITNGPALALELAALGSASSALAPALTLGPALAMQVGDLGPAVSFFAPSLAVDVVAYGARVLNGHTCSFSRVAGGSLFRAARVRQGEVFTGCRVTGRHHKQTRVEGGATYQAGRCRIIIVMASYVLGESVGSRVTFEYRNADGTYTAANPSEVVVTLRKAGISRTEDVSSTVTAIGGGVYSVSVPTLSRGAGTYTLKWYGSGLGPASEEAAMETTFTVN